MAVVDDTIDDAVDDDWELHGDVGGAFCHRRCGKIPVGGVSTAEQVAVLRAQHFAFTTRNQDRLFDAVGERTLTTQRFYDGLVEQARATAVGAGLREGGDVLSEDAEAVEEGVEGREKGEDGETIFGVEEEEEIES